MGWLDEAAVETVKHKPAKCVVGRWLETLDKKNRIEAEELLASAFPLLAKHRVILRHYPQVFGDRTLDKHIGGRCCCVAQ